MNIGKVLKQAKQMQEQMKNIQGDLAAKSFDVSAGGGAVQVKANGSGMIESLKLSEELLKEDTSLVEETILSAIQDVISQAKEHAEGEMKQVTAGLNLPNIF